MGEGSQTNHFSKMLWIIFHVIYFSVGLTVKSSMKKVIPEATLPTWTAFTTCLLLEPHLLLYSKFTEEEQVSKKLRRLNWRGKWKTRWVVTLHEGNGGSAPTQGICYTCASRFSLGSFTHTVHCPGKLPRSIFNRTLRHIRFFRINGEPLNLK